MTEIERIIKEFQIISKEHPSEYEKDLAKALEDYVIKARIKDRETTKSLMEYTGDTDLWYEDNNKKLAELKQKLEELG